MNSCTPPVSKIFQFQRSKAHESKSMTLHCPTLLLSIEMWYLLDDHGPNPTFIWLISIYLSIYLSMNIYIYACLSIETELTKFKMAQNRPFLPFAFFGSETMDFWSVLIQMGEISKPHRIHVCYKYGNIYLQYTPFMLALIYQHHGSVMGTIPKPHGSLVMSPCFTSPNHDRYMVY